MKAKIDAMAWPVARLGEAVEALAQAGGLAPAASGPHASITAAEAADDAKLAPWLERVGRAIGVEVEAVVEPYERVERALVATAPCVVRVARDSGPEFLCLLGGRGGSLRALSPDWRIRALTPSAARAALCGSIETSELPSVERLLDRAGISPSRSAAARQAVLRQRLAGAPVAGCWSLGLPAGAEFQRQLRHDGHPLRFAGLVFAHGVYYLLSLLSWWLVGRGALEGRLDRGWLAAWFVLLVTMIPLRLAAGWWQGVLALGVGGLLKRRLLHGMLRCDPESIRHQGAGQLLGRVIEAEAVESLALGGGFTALVAFLELALAVVVMALSPGGGIHAALLVTWLCGAGWVAWRAWRRRATWTRARLSMTHALVERMCGHRTRLAQEPPDIWHEGEDQGLAHYARVSEGMDRLMVWLTVVAPRGWLIVGLAAIAPAFVFGRGAPAALAVSLGGMLLGYRGIHRLAAGMTQLAGAAIAWGQVAPFFRGGADDESSRSTDEGITPLASSAAGAAGTNLLEGRDLVFQHRGRAEPVLRGCHLAVRSGDRILLEGPSGGGKSTLASIITGLRRPASGLLLMGGLDRHTWGPRRWRRHVTAAPQYHENHVLTGTLAFNLLMGRRWPPSADDLNDADALCRELGLGGLLDRMPAGLQQMVGETGWQLSQGERSRLFIARALLQRADLVVLDESFAALDPESLVRSLACVLARAPALLVIAHP